MALFITASLSHADSQTTGAFFLIFAAGFYGAAEFAVSEFQLYRHGIEEALLVCSIGSSCAGLYLTLPKSAEFLVPTAGATLSLRIAYRFNLNYAFPTAMIFVVWMSGYMTDSPSARHLIIAGAYAAGLIVVAKTCLPVFEAFLWIGVYAALNLELFSLAIFDRWRGGSHLNFPSAFYWSTWVMTWCLPSLILWRGVRRKDRLVIAVGALLAVLTLVTNKSYLGWQRNTWDPMILGMLLIAAALFLRRWLSRGPGGVRSGFTARRFSGKEKEWMAAGSTVFGAAVPDSTTLNPQPSDPGAKFRGGESGGGGATSDF